jgi:hypothetical protein
MQAASATLEPPNLCTFQGESVIDACNEAWPDFHATLEKSGQASKQFIAIAA